MKDRNNLIFVKMPGQRIDEDADIIIDCSDIDGTNAYCDETAKEELRRRFYAYGYDGVHILGSGNYHYLSLFWTEKIEEDYALVLIDHHPDCQQSAFAEVISCGGWVREALLTQTHLKKVYMLGVDEGLLSEVIEAAVREEKDMITASESESRNAAGDAWYASIEHGFREDAKSLPLFISIDTDALSPDYVACDWDQGEMTIDELTGILKNLSRDHRILGVDICGEKKDPTEKEYGLNRDTQRAICDAFCAQEI